MQPRYTGAGAIIDPKAVAEVLRLYVRKQISMNKTGVLPAEANKVRVQSMIQVDMHHRRVGPSRCSDWMLSAAAVCEAEEQEDQEEEE